MTADQPLITFNAPTTGGGQNPSQGDRDAFRSGGQTYETPKRPTVTVPRPNPSGGQPQRGGRHERRG